MPIYDYTCSKCRGVTEVIHGINDQGPKFCPQCGAEGTMTKKFVAPTIHFKGSGWAKKDRSTARASRTKDEGGSAASAGEANTATESSASDSGSTGADVKKTDAGTSGDSKGSSKPSSGSSSSSSD
jgi:putative FmdB family regulatory protein